MADGWASGLQHPVDHHNADQSVRLLLFVLKKFLNKVLRFPSMKNHIVNRDAVCRSSIAELISNGSRLGIKRPRVGWSQWLG